LASKLPLTLACGDYEIVRALKDGSVQPDGIELTVLTKMDSTTRHWRMLRNREFDVSEISCSSYLVGRDQGLDMISLPVFLHRRFRHGFIFVNAGKKIRKASDLNGKKIGLKQFQATALVWLRGILQHEYGVDLTSIDWICDLDETIEFTPPPGIRISKVGHDQSVEDMLANGELDAVIHPDLIKPIMNKDPRVARLFPDYRAEEVAYFKKTGIFPIMHVLGIKNEILERHPWVAINLYHAFDQAKNVAMKRMTNPRIVPLAWYREVWEEQEELMGTDPWEYGLTPKNVHTLDTLAGYAHEQGMTRRRLTMDDLFVPVDQGRKRGVEFRF
jgi:4,5-dihydroxyphthalate decarboxylase